VILLENISTGYFYIKAYLQVCRRLTQIEKQSVVDLFCGAGGISEGFRQAGFDILLGIDCDSWSIKTYNRNRQRLEGNVTATALRKQLMTHIGLILA
jgi:DNA (cytosine-5)-methyltransferase 1